jgi:hypothetical protein
MMSEDPPGGYPTKSLIGLAWLMAGIAKLAAAPAANEVN